MGQCESSVWSCTT